MASSYLQNSSPYDAYPIYGQGQPHVLGNTGNQTQPNLPNPGIPATKYLQYMSFEKKFIIIDDINYTYPPVKTPMGVPLQVPKGKYFRFQSSLQKWVLEDLYPRKDFFPQPTIIEINPNYLIEEAIPKKAYRIREKPEDQKYLLGSSPSPPRTGQSEIPIEHFIEYVPFQKKYIEYDRVETIVRVPYEREIVEYEQIVHNERIPIQRTITDYYAVQTQIEYIPKQIEQTIVDYEPVEKSWQRVQYLPVETQIVHFPEQQKYVSQQGRTYGEGNYIQMQSRTRGMTEYNANSQYKSGAYSTAYQSLNSGYTNGGYTNGYVNGGYTNGYVNGGYPNGGYTNGYPNGYTNSGYSNSLTQNGGSYKENLNYKPVFYNDGRRSNASDQAIYR